MARDALAAHRGRSRRGAQDGGRASRAEAIRLSRALTGLAAIAALCGGCGSGAPPGPPRHLLLISLDTTRADHLGPYGGEAAPTPALDRLAREGATFLDVTAPAPTTLATHTSLMTGLAPRSHGVPGIGFRVPERNRMLAEILRDAGFRTAGFPGAFVLSARFGFDQGFELFDEDYAPEPGAHHDEYQRRADAVMDAALAWIDAAHGERLFAFLHFYDAHAPYDPPRAWAPAGAAGEDDGDATQRRRLQRHMAVQDLQRRVLGEAPGLGAVTLEGLPRALATRASTEPSALDRELAALYAGEIAFVDAQIGRLLEQLAERGLMDETLLVVTGDHGETFWEHGDFWNHGLTVYDTAMRVPLILRLPDRRAAGLRVAEPVSLLDVLPTLLELLELPVGAPVEGRSLAPALAGARLEPRTAFCEATKPTGALSRGVAWPNDRKAHCARSGRWKYIATPYLELEELYDLDSDPLEQRNLLIDPTPEALRQRDRLAAELASWSARPTARDERRGDADPEVRRRLEQLGYLADEP